MVLGVVTFAAVLVVLGNLVADLLYAAVDPRIRLA
jgi:peptide/nickel transport system permease protein